MGHCHSGLFCDSRAYNVSNVQLIQLNDGSCEVIQLFVFVFRRNEATSRHKVSSDDETNVEQSVIRCWMSVQQSNSSRPFNGLNMLSMKGRFIKKKSILFNKLLDSLFPCQGILLYLSHVMDV